jgi:hypothetical protein
MEERALAPYGFSTVDSLLTQGAASFLYPCRRRLTQRLPPRYSATDQIVRLEKGEGGNVVSELFITVPIRIKHGSWRIFAERPGTYRNLTLGACFGPITRPEEFDDGTSCTVDASAHNRIRECLFVC